MRYKREKVRGREKQTRGREREVNVRDRMRKTEAEGQ